MLKKGLILRRDVVARALIVTAVAIVLTTAHSGAQTSVAGAAIPVDSYKTVTAAGTAEALTSTSTGAVWVTIQCLVDNTGNCFVGASTAADGRGVELAPGQSVHLPPLGSRNSYDLSRIYVDTEQSAEGVSFLYVQEGP